jgi:hypothetical protein
MAIRPIEKARVHHAGWWRVRRVATRYARAAVTMCRWSDSSRAVRPVAAPPRLECLSIQNLLTRQPQCQMGKQPRVPKGWNRKSSMSLVH